VATLIHFIKSYHQNVIDHGQGVFDWLYKPQLVPMRHDRYANQGISF